MPLCQQTLHLTPKNADMQLTRVIVKLSVACIFALAAVAAVAWQFIKLTKKKY